MLNDYRKWLLITFREWLVKSAWRFGGLKNHVAISSKEVRRVLAALKWVTRSSLLYGFIWQPHVVFRNGRTPRARADEVVQFGVLNTLAEFVAFRKPVQD